MKQLVRFLKPYPQWVACIFLLLILQAYCDLSLPTYMSRIVTVGIQEGEMGAAAPLIGVKMLALSVMGMGASVVAGYISARVAADLGKNLRREVFKKVVHFSHAEFDRFSTASLITRSTNDIQQIQMLAVMMLRIVLFAPIMAAGGILKVVKTNVTMFWVIAIGVLAILSVVVFLFVLVMPKFKQVQRQVDGLNLVSREILTGIQVIRAFGNGKYEEERFDRANEDLTQTNLFVNRAMIFMMPVMMLIMNMISLLIIWVGGHRISQGGMDVGDMMAFIQYTMEIIISFLMICMISIILPRAAVSAERVREILDSQTKIKDPEVPVALPGKAGGSLSFHRVSFSYPGAEMPALQDISFTASSGETTAIIGSTGSGKTTLLNLIPRFYDVTAGRIEINGEDIRNLSLHTLREQVGLVPQKAVLFSGKIEDNILYGVKEENRDVMEEAARISRSLEFIEDKEEGFGSTVAQGGANFSGGQKQRLAIARAIAKEPRIFLFDDSFSALDYKTDRELREALAVKTRESVVLIVAQRISTIMKADQIIVLEQGKIAGIGTHDQLMKTCDEYRYIALSQLSEEELGKSSGRSGRERQVK